MNAVLRATYIGDEITAIGLALVGVTPRVTPTKAAAVWQAMNDARQASDLVILDQTLAGLVQARLQELVSTEPRPPVVIMPSLGRDETASDSVVASARRTLGLG